jgi:hypothetical protein
MGGDLQTTQVAKARVLPEDLHMHLFLRGGIHWWNFWWLLRLLKAMLMWHKAGRQTAWWTARQAAFGGVTLGSTDDILVGTIDGLPCRTLDPTDDGISDGYWDGTLLDKRIGELLGKLIGVKLGSWDCVSVGTIHAGETNDFGWSWRGRNHRCWNDVQG